jgi:flavin-dependent dehydrogenase
MYTTELADVDAWIGKSAAGADVIPSTVVDDAVNGGWTITFGSAVVTVNLVDPATLDTLNVPGIEGIELAV